MSTGPTPPPAFAFDNSFARQLEGLYVPWQPAAVPQPVLVRLNRALADELGLDADALDSPQGAAIFAGNRVPDGAAPLAQAYAGHQFGGFSPQLGDGRALLLGELIDRHGRRRDIALKGSGRTPFSRGGDGKAALGPVLREYLIGEAMHALGIPTTRALAAVTTGEPVYRETPLPGAVLTRVAASHIRVGTFQFFAARGEIDKLRLLVDHCIARHGLGPAGAADGVPGDALARPADVPPALALLRAVAERQAELVARWLGVGFIHGVMNTDNMTVSGETIDYGPCAFMDAYDPDTVFSSIDTGGRYAYANQPLIARWNLARLAEALLPLLDADADSAVALATEVIDAFPALHEAHWLGVMRRKLGLTGAAPDDLSLARDFLSAMAGHEVDFTLAFRRLADAAEGNEVPLRALWADAGTIAAWLARWQARLAAEPGSAADHARAIRQANPLYIPRNHRVEAALAAAVDQGDLGPFNHLLQVLARPFDVQADALPASAEQAQGYRTFCGT